jgi:serine/threonine protein kinase
LDHPNIVNIIEIWEWNKLFFIVTDYYPGGELSDILKARGYLEEFEVFKFMNQMVSVLMYLEENQISHRDIKLQNFLLKETNDLSNIKLIDFGLSKDLTYDNLVKNISGTPFYVAPEILNQQGC